MAPFDERAHRLALAAAVQAGDPAAARRVATRLATALDDLDVTPAAETAMAMRQAQHLLDVNADNVAAPAA